MDELNEDENGKLIVSQLPTCERSPTARLEAKPEPDAICMEMRKPKCLREFGKAHGGDSFTDEYCLELLAGAAQDNLYIWERMQQRLRETVRGWMEHHPSRTIVASLDSEENCVAQTLAKLFETASCERMRLSNHSDVLKYLQASLNGVILDSQRSNNASLNASLLERIPLSHTAESTATGSTKGEVWEILSKLLPDVREKRIAYLLFHCGLKPKDIVHTFPEEFDDEREITFLRCTIIARMLDYVDQHDGSILIGTQIPTMQEPDEGE